MSLNKVKWGYIVRFLEFSKKGTIYNKGLLKINGNLTDSDNVMLMPYNGFIKSVIINADKDKFGFRVLKNTKDLDDDSFLEEYIDGDFNYITRYNEEYHFNAGDRLRVVGFKYDGGKPDDLYITLEVHYDPRFFITGSIPKD